MAVIGHTYLLHSLPTIDILQYGKKIVYLHFENSNYGETAFNDPITCSYKPGTLALTLLLKSISTIGFKVDFQK